MNTTYILSLITTTVEATACLLCARILWRLRREGRDRSRRLLAIGSLCSGLLATFVVVANIVFPFAAQEGAPMLSPWICFVYMSMHIIMTLYPITVVDPKWFNPRRAFFFFLPVAVFFVIFHVFSICNAWTTLDTPESIWANVWKLDVFFRLASLFTMIPYCLILLFLPYNYRHSSASLWWNISYCFGLTVICCIHIVFTLTQWPLLVILIPVLAAVFYLLSTKYELEDRLIPEEVEDYTEEPSAVVAEPVIGDLELWGRICIIMDKEEAWRDPDISLKTLAQKCATNITYLNREIQEKTGGGFKEMVNSKRVDSVVNQLRINPSLDIQTAFFNSGFRSRATAWRNFKDKMGVTPTEFKQSLNK